ncbi:MAG: class I SAM-dependent methyltransferase [Blautia sp.]
MQALNERDVSIDYAFMVTVEKFMRHGCENVPDYMLSGSQGDFTGVGDIHFFYSADEVFYGAFPDKEAAYREVFRVLRPGGTSCGCFYVMGEHKRTDWFVRYVYEKAGFFTPPYETVSSLKARLDGMYTDVDMGNLKSMAWFVCRKAG